MAWLLVDLHRAGVFWGDCSLANTLFRRDGDKIQAFLVDAETSEIHPTLSDGQRAYDLEILVENVAFGLADLARDAGPRRTPSTTRSPRPRPSARATPRVWDELHFEPELSPDDRHAVRARIRRLNDLGFAVDEIQLEPAGAGAARRSRLRVAVTNRRFHARELERLTGLVALEGQARLLLNDLREYRAWLECYDRRPIDRAGGGRALARATSSSRASTALVPADRRRAATLQAYCDVLEEKWILSELAGHDVGLEAAIDAYLGLGAPGARGRPRAPDSRSRSTSTGRGGLDDARRHRRLSRPSAHARADSRAMASLSRRAGAGRAALATDAGHPRPRGLVKRYGDLVAVDGIDFDVAPRRGLRPARAERRRQDDDGRDPRGPARARRRRGRRCSASTSRPAPTRSSRASGSASRPRPSTRS